MKRILAIVLCLVLSLGCLVGCKWKEEEKTEANQEIFGINEKGDTVPLAESEVVKEINTKIQNLANEVGSSRYDEEKVSGSISGLKSDVKSLRGKDKEFEGEFGVIKGDLDAVNKGLNETNEKLKETTDELKKNVEDLRIKDEELEKNDIKLGKAIGDIWRTLPGIISKFINDFYSKKIKPELTTLRFKIMGIEKQLGILTNRLASDETKIGQNSDAIKENAEAITQNATAIGQNAEAITRNATAIGQNAEAITQNIAAINTNAGNISTNKQSIEATLLDHLGTLNTHWDKIQGIDARVTALEGELSPIHEFDRYLEEEINQLKARVDALEDSDE